VNSLNLILIRFGFGCFILEVLSPSYSSDYKNNSHSYIYWGVGFFS